MTDASTVENGSKIVFEDLIVCLFSERICSDEEFAKRIYAALTNMIWVNGNREWSATFRYVGGMIQDIIDSEKGSYMDWYCCSQEGVVDFEIELELRKYGWSSKEYALKK